MLGAVASMGSGGFGQGRVNLGAAPGGSECGVALESEKEKVPSCPCAPREEAVPSRENEGISQSVNLLCPALTQQGWVPGRGFPGARK